MKLTPPLQNSNALGPLFSWAESQTRTSSTWQHNRLAQQWGVSVLVASVIATSNGLGPREAA